MKKYIYPMALAATLLTTAGCSDDEVMDNSIPDDQKEKIAFTTSAETGSASASSETRAGFTGGREYTSQSFATYGTQIIARFSSAKSSTEIRHTKTILIADYDPNAQKGANWESCSTVNYSDGYERYWDDAFGRDANISVYAVAVPNKTAVKNNSTALFNLVQKGTANAGTDNPNWQTDTETDELNSIAWQVSTAQTEGFEGTIATEDLCYSHNIQSATDATTDLQYGKGKDGVRSWGANATYDTDSDGYPEYKYLADDTDHYPSLDNGELKFRQADGASSDAPGHFDKGHMIFHHALSRITVKLNMSTEDGFKADASDFVLTSDNITLLNMPFKGTLNIKDGKWNTYTAGEGGNNANIKMAAQSSSTGSYTEIAQVIPGYELGKDATTNVMKFTISEQTYYITQKQLYKALIEVTANTTNFDSNGNKLVTVKDDKIALEQGKNYVFTITVKKTGIANVTCSLVPWIDVTGNAEATNAYVKINIMDSTSEFCKHFDLYRMNDDSESIYAPTTGPGTGTDWTENYNWYGTKGTDASLNYTDKAELTETSTTNVWKTNWFWESNKSFYHFRSVNTGVAIQNTTSTDKDLFNIYSGPIQDYDATHTTISTEAKDGKVNDYHWGAPFKPGANLKYDVQYGWSAAQDKDGQIYPAIGSTNQQINIIEHHVMSNVHIILKTTKDETKTNKVAEGGVNLTNSTVKLTNFINSGIVEMGRGLVTPNAESTTTKVSESMSVPVPFYATEDDNTETKSYDYRVVPQPLYRGSKTDLSEETDLTQFIGLTIITPDNNQYYVIKDLSTVLATSVKQNNANYTGSNQEVNKKIERWYPGHDYTYTITISKKGIEAITCSVVDWIYVTADNIYIDLED